MSPPTGVLHRAGGKLSGWLRRHCRMALLVLTALIALAGATVWQLQQRPAPAPSSVVERGDIEQTVQAAGVLEPRIKVDVGARASGQIETLHVELGQAVQRGQRLLSIDPEPSRSQLRQDDAAIRKQQSQIEAKRIAAALAESYAKRQRQLDHDGATTAVDVEQAVATAAQQQAELQGLQAELSRLQAERAGHRLQLGYTAVTAPLDGEVVDIAVKPGQTVNAEQSTPTLLTLAQLDPMTVRAKVAEADILAIAPGQSASFTTLGQDTRSYAGRVRLVARQAAKPAKGASGGAVSFDVLFDVANPEHSLLAGMTVKVEFTVGAARQVPLLPLTALGVRGADGRYAVQVLDAAGRSGTRQVRIGIQDAAHAQVLDGVGVGERVLLATGS